MIVAQNFACKTNSTSFSTINTSQLSCLASGGPIGIEYYVPNITTMPTLTFNVNFVFLDDPDPAKISFYEPHSATSLSVDCQTAINLLNSTYATIGNNAQFLTPLNPSPLVPESKIRFKLNKVYKISDSNGTIPCPPSGTIQPIDVPNFVSNFGQDQTTCINLVFVNIPANCSIGFSAIANDLGSMYMGKIGTGPYTLGGNILPIDLLAHEMAHTLGRLSDYYATNTIIPVPASVLNFTYMQNNTNPLVGFGYSPDDSTPEVIPFADCSNPSSPTYIYRNNNLMGNNCSPKVLSAK